MITSTTLCSVPFIGNCDNARLQMSAKQLAQTVTSLKCEIPKVIGEDYKYLSDSTFRYKYTAPYDGEILYINSDIMILYLKTETGNIIKYNEIPNILRIYELYSTQLRYCKSIGSFKAGDLLYEYDCFKNGIPSYGYNILSSYIPFFGYNNQDAIAISESMANLCSGVKSERIFIPIYSYSLFKMIYNNDFKFLPDIGETINGDIICYKSVLKSKTNIINTLKSMNISDFTKIVLDTNYFDNIPITSRIPNGKINDIRIHRNRYKYRKPVELIDQHLQTCISKICNKHIDRINNIRNDVKFLYKDGDSTHFIGKYYVNADKLSAEDYNLQKLEYLIELNIVKEYNTEIGDKFSNRYANKGVVSIIFPDELRPYTLYNKKPINCLIGSLSPVSRMNFGQILDGLISKVIVDCEEKILKDKIDPKLILQKISKLTRNIKNDKYADKIDQLILNMKNNPIVESQFITSIKELGLYYECPSFANFDLNYIEREIKNDFNITGEEPVVYPKKLLEYMRNKLKLQISLPDDDWVVNNLFTAPIYTVKLKQLSSSRNNAREFGSYKSSTHQPV